MKTLMSNEDELIEDFDGLTASVNLILGTMTFGENVDVDVAEDMLNGFTGHGLMEVDTAHVYNDGESERLLGRILQRKQHAKVRVATKVNPRVTGRLDVESIRRQLDESLRRLQLDSVAVLYLHFPDPRTPVEQTLEACAMLHEQGRFKELGLSNYPAWAVVHIWHLCRERGWPAPSVYQGLYNALSRNVEPELLPALKELGLRFYAYNPLAGGLLTGRYRRFEDVPGSGRFSHRPNYQKRYWKASFFEALQVLEKECQVAEVSIVSAALRWLAYDSRLDSRAADGIVLGASSVEQLTQNIASCTAGPLPESVSEAFTAAWEAARPDSPAYFRTVGG